MSKHSYPCSIIFIQLLPYIKYGDNRQRALRKRNFVVMGFVMKLLWQDHTFVMKCTLNALCLMGLYQVGSAFPMHTDMQAVNILAIKAILYTY